MRYQEKQVMCISCVNSEMDKVSTNFYVRLGSGFINSRITYMELIKSSNLAFSCIVIRTWTVEKRTYDFSQDLIKTPSGDFKQLSEEF